MSALRMILAILALLCLLNPAQAKSGTTWIVNENARGKGHAVSSLPEALDRAAAGDTIIVTTDTPSGIVRKPLTIRGTPNATIHGVQFLPGEQTRFGLVLSEGSDGTVLEDLNIDADVGILVGANPFDAQQGPNDVEIRDCSIDGVVHGIITRDVDGWSIVDNRIELTSGDGSGLVPNFTFALKGISFEGGITNSVISGNVITREGGAEIPQGSGALGIEIQGAPFAPGIGFGTTDNLEVSDNEIAVHALRSGDPIAHSIRLFAWFDDITNVAVVGNDLLGSDRPLQLDSSTDARLEPSNFIDDPVCVETPPIAQATITDLLVFDNASPACPTSGP